MVLELQTFLKNLIRQIELKNILKLFLQLMFLQVTELITL